MNWLFILASVIIYSTSAAISYSSLKSHPSYVPIGVVLGTLANTLWFLLTKRIATDTELFFWAMLWDSVIVLTFVAVPLVFFGVKLPALGYLGVALTVAGLLCIKLSTN